MEKKPIRDWAKRMMLGQPFFEIGNDGHYLRTELNNLNVSECFNCRKLSVWVHSKLVFPSKKTAARPANDLPEDIKVIFEEARAIFDESPRGAAALFRLCVQMLYVHLGEK